MKKVLYTLMGIVLLTGCSCTANMENTPTAKVEEYLNKYQTNDEDVISDLEDVLLSDTSLTSDERTEYSEFMQSHYQDLQYEIKDETIDGDSATVEAEITVRSYADVLNEVNEYRLNNADEFDDTNTFASYRLEKLKEVTDTETYTIIFYLTKEDEEWVLENPSEDDLNKINGVYGVSDINYIETTEDEEDVTDDTSDTTDDETDDEIADDETTTQ